MIICFPYMKSSLAVRYAKIIALPAAYLIYKERLYLPVKKYSKYDICHLFSPLD